MIGKRHEQMILWAAAVMVSYSLRLNTSVGIVAMTNKNSDSNAPVLNWSTFEQGLVLSSFFWGYGIPQIVIGLMSVRMSSTKILNICMVLSGVLTCLCPVASVYGSYIGVVATRAIIGILQGCLMPCLNTLFARWCIPQERSRVYCYVFGGGPIGSFVTTLAGGAVADTPVGWPIIFYATGLSAVIWSLASFCYGVDSPEEHKTISKIEKDFIDASFGAKSVNSEVLPVPWLEIFKSKPFWALLITHTCNCWGYWTMASLTPTYLHSVLGYDLTQNGIISAIPYAANWLLGMLLSVIADYVTKKKIVTQTVSRKFWNSLALYGEAAALAALSSLLVPPVGCVALIWTTNVVNAAVSLGFLANHLDLSPNFAGILVGITNTVANCASVLGPLVSASLLKNWSDEANWRTIFLLAAVVSFFGNTVFLAFGSTDVQLWNQPKNSKSDNSESQRDTNSNPNHSFTT